MWGENGDGMAWFKECVDGAVENIKKRKESAAAEDEGARTVVFRLSVPRNGRRDERLSFADQPSLAKAKNTTYYTLRAVLEVLLECRLDGERQVAAGFDVDVCIFAVVAAVFECAKFESNSLLKLLKGPGTKDLREVESMIVDVAAKADERQCLLVMRGVVRDALVAGMVEAGEGKRDAFVRMVEKVSEQVDLPKERMYDLRHLDNATVDRENFQKALENVYATNVYDALMWKNKRKGDAFGENEEHHPQSKRQRMTGEEAGSGSRGNVNMNANANGAGGSHHGGNAKSTPRGGDVGGGEETGGLAQEKYVKARGDVFAEVGVYALRDDRAMKMLGDGWDRLVTEQKLLSPEDVIDIMDKMVLVLINAM